MTRKYITSCLLFILMATQFIFAQQPGNPERQIEHLTAQLELSDAQVDKVQQIYAMMDEQAKEDQELNQDNPKALKDAAKARKNTIEQLIENILTEEQKTKYAKIKKTRPNNDMTQDLIEKLKLSDEQAEKVASIISDSQEQMQDLRENRSGNRRDMIQKMRTITQDRDKKIEDVLSDDQKKIYEEIKQERQNQMRERMGGRQGGRRR